MMIHADVGDDEGPIYLVTYLWPPVNTMVSPSGIPHVACPLCFSLNIPPPINNRLISYLQGGF